MVGNTSNEPTTADVAKRLQQLGLKEYEAKCFVALTALSSGTAREISKAVDVPRTRVYEAARALESHGLIHVQHSSPQRFRAVPIEDAISILRDRYESRIDKLEDELQEVETTTTGGQDDDGPEIWAITGHEAIRTRTSQLLENATEQIMLVVTDDRLLSSPLFGWLQTAGESGCDITVGTTVDTARQQLTEALSDCSVSRSELNWLHPGQSDEAPPVSFLLAVDAETVLISACPLTVTEHSQHAIYGTGDKNSMVVVFCRLLQHGLAEQN